MLSRQREAVQEPVIEENVATAGCGVRKLEGGIATVPKMD
jgi:hypothetical protein